MIVMRKEIKWNKMLEKDFKKFTHGWFKPRRQIKGSLKYIEHHLSKWVIFVKYSSDRIISNAAKWFWFEMTKWKFEVSFEVFELENSIYLPISKNGETMDWPKSQIAQLIDETRTISIIPGFTIKCSNIFYLNILNYISKWNEGVDGKYIFWIYILNVILIYEPSIQ